MQTTDCAAARATEAWAGILGTPVAALAEPGVTVIPRPDARRAIGWLQVVGTVVSAPADLVTRVRDLGKRATRLDRLADTLASQVVSTTGPARIGWLPDGWGADLDPQRARRGVTTIDPADHRLTAFHNRLPPTDQEAWRVLGHHGHAMVRGGRVIAAALTEDVADTLAHLGVATATDHRLAGHATTVTVAACLAAHDRDRVPQYRSAERNSAGWRVARSVGFEHRATQALLHLTRP